ncbi:LuxR C-terminal-related transcriptional regulator [Amycolatopsis jejuensis]|uniref:LuxR C-terminal-related transcriptional regulator n=1 Tax=Amycolatopsis jejuensis TaxID=330084 RepID=UPI0005276FC2|nr:LuxR C-terminal-related transcriptional regulator [Amycolatopsis jejuensis]
MDPTPFALGAGKPLKAVTGPTGIGRTTILTRMGEEYVRQGVRVYLIRFTRDGDAVPVGFPGSSTGWSLPGSVPGARNDPAIAHRAAVAIAASLVRGADRTVALLDDAQWMGEDLQAVFGALARRLSGPVGCVAAIRTPSYGTVPGADWIRRLREDGLLETVRVRPMDAAAVARLLTAITKARPDSALLAEVIRLGRGVPAAVRDAVDFLRRNGSVRTVGGTAFLAVPTKPATPSVENEFARVVRGLGEPAQAVARAMALLAPFGADAPRLVAEALGRTIDETSAVLHQLRQEGILHCSDGGRTWRFPIPLVADALTAAMGPFERRQLAAQAVRAVWDGEAQCADLGHLTDLVADAGRMVDARHALDVLLPRLTEPAGYSAASVSRWLGMALELAEDRRERTIVLRRLVATGAEQGDHRRAFSVAQFLLTELADQLSPAAAQEVQATTVRSLKNIGDLEVLHDIAEFRRRWPGDNAQALVTRAYAYAQLDEWRAARDLLADTEAQWQHGSSAAARYGAALQVLAGLWTGDHEPLERSLASGEHTRLGSDFECLTGMDTYVAALLSIGDSVRAEKLLVDANVPATRLRLGNQAALAALRGSSAEALTLAKRSLATGADQGYVTNSAAMWVLVVTTLVMQGNLTMARDILATVRESAPPLAHLLDIAEAMIENALGREDLAAEKLTACLAAEAEQGLLIGSDDCWLQLAGIAFIGGDEEELRRCLAGLDKVVQVMPTSRAVAGARLVRAIAYRDREAAAECLRLFRERGHPLELVTAAAWLVRAGVADPALLREGYETLGGLDALLLRSWLRSAMRDHDVAVPGRKETLAENERLLALLAADGLTNKQLAAALRTSEKSVESRLSRLFARTGYRSRIELSTAILTGEL